MKRRSALLVLLLLPAPLAVSAQSRGVRFERGVSWEEAQDMAGVANKYLFAVVCTPRASGCRTMDTSVFARDRVGAAINARFIAVKVRGDTSTSSAAAAESLYIDAPELREYKITTFPTYLFFSADGKILHRAAGERDVDGLLALVADALDPRQAVLRAARAVRTREEGL